MKRIAMGIGIAIVVLVVLVIGVSLFINANQFRPMLQARLTKALGRDVSIGDLKLALLSGGVAAENLAVADDPAFSNGPFLKAHLLKVGVELVPLVFSRKLNITHFTVDQPEVVLLQNAAGKWNFSSLGTQPATQSKPEPAAEVRRQTSEQPNAAAGAPAHQDLDLRVALVSITNGRVSLGTVGGHSGPQVFENVDADLKDFSAASSFPFSLSTTVAGGGQIRLDGRAGPLNSVDTAMTPLTANLRITSLNLAGSHFVEPSSGISGIISLQGSVNSNGQVAETKGHIRGEQLKFAKNGSPARRPAEFDFALAHDLRTRAGSLSRGDIHLGAALAKLTGTYTVTGETTALNMKLAGANMPVPELEAMLPAVGAVLPSGSSLQGGTAHINLAMNGPTDRLVTVGSLGLDNTRLVGFDLGSKLKAIAALAGVGANPNTDIQTLSTNLRSTPEGTSFDAMQLVVPSIGTLTGAGTVSPNHALDFKMLAKVQATGVVQTALGQRASAGVPFFIKGTASSPSFVPDVRGIVSSQIGSVLDRSNAGKAATGLLDNLLGRKKR